MVGFDVGLVLDVAGSPGDVAEALLWRLVDFTHPLADCGPKMQHYLRHALLTLLSDERPQTILELVRILTDDAFRRPFVERLDDR